MGTKVRAHWKAHLNMQEEEQWVEVPDDIKDDPDKVRAYVHDVVADSILDDWGFSVDILSAKTEWDEIDLLEQDDN